MKIRFSYPRQSMDFSLSLATKSVKYTINYDGLVPSPLVFGIVPKLLSTKTKIQIQQDRIDSILMGCHEIGTIASNHRVKMDLSHNVPLSSTYEFKIDEEVLVYREQ